MKHYCTDDVKKNLKVMAIIVIVFFVFTMIGVNICIFLLINYFTNVAVFPFSDALDPPYLIVLFIVLTILAVPQLIMLRNLKRTVCKNVEIPFIN